MEALIIGFGGFVVIIFGKGLIRGLTFITVHDVRVSQNCRVAQISKLYTLAHLTLVGIVEVVEVFVLVQIVVVIFFRVIFIMGFIQVMVGDRDQISLMRVERR